MSDLATHVIIPGGTPWRYFVCATPNGSVDDAFDFARERPSLRNVVGEFATLEAAQAAYPRSAILHDVDPDTDADKVPPAVAEKLRAISRRAKLGLLFDDE